MSRGCHRDDVPAGMSVSPWGRWDDAHARPFLEVAPKKLHGDRWDGGVSPPSPSPTPCSSPVWHMAVALPHTGATGPGNHWPGWESRVVASSPCAMPGGGVSRVSPGVWCPWDRGFAEGTPPTHARPAAVTVTVPHHLRPCPHRPSHRAQVSRPTSNPPGVPRGDVTGVLLRRRSSVEVPPEELGLPGPYGTSALPPWSSRGAEAGGPCASPKPTGCPRGAGRWAGRSSRTSRPVPSPGWPRTSRGFAVLQGVGATGPASRMT